MGVVYKLEPEITDFILEKKKTDTGLSCRQISKLILDKFQVNVSKSSVNSIMKGAGLSVHVGRRLKKRRPKKALQVPPLPLLEARTAEAPVLEIKPETPPAIIPIPENTGILLLKAADSLVGLSRCLNELIGQKGPVESLIYGPLFNQDLTPLLNLPEEQKNSIAKGLRDRLPCLFQGVRCIKLILSDNTAIYLDGQFHTVWSVPHMPYAFSAPVYHVKNRLNSYLNQNSPLVLFMAPGYDSPTPEFLAFLSALDANEKGLLNITLCGNKLEELENMAVEKRQKYTYIFGLWPWQFPEYRKVKSLGEFRPYHHKYLSEDLFLADIEIELAHPRTKEILCLKGCTLKKEINGKIELVILGNLPEEKNAQGLADAYLSRWPNLQEGFQDYSRKVEFFTYTANSQSIFSTDKIGSEKKPPEDAAGDFEHCLKALDLYVRWYFLPLGYEDKDFPVAKERFYDLECKLSPEKDFILAAFSPPPGYSFLKDLQYACRRINEKEILFAGKRLWCTTK